LCVARISRNFTNAPRAKKRLNHEKTPLS
jgi:hypothetical protein